MHHMDADEMFKEKAWRELRKNEQIREPTSHEK